MGPHDEYNDDSIYDPGAPEDVDWEKPWDEYEDELEGLNSADVL